MEKKHACACVKPFFFSPYYFLHEILSRKSSRLWRYTIVKHNLFSVPFFFHGRGPGGGGGGYIMCIGAKLQYKRLYIHFGNRNFFFNVHAITQ